MSITKFKKKDLVFIKHEDFPDSVLGEIIEFRNHNTQAYVHLINQDKRLDRWVDIGQLQLSPDQKNYSTKNKRIIDNSDEEQTDLMKFEEVHKEITKIRNIDMITIGNYTIRTWYFSPFPYPFFEKDHLYICEHCFTYFASEKELQDHKEETKERKPPGREIYRDGNISIFELTGKNQKISCQNLCLLSKLFLDHKTLFYDVEGFEFFVLCECDNEGAHIAAYFSREIKSAHGNILACITTLPPYQKKGYGNLLISLSYELAKRQKRSGGPETPLSDLGKIAFKKYWKQTIISVLKNDENDIRSIDDIVVKTAIDRNDIIKTLKKMNLVREKNDEFRLVMSRERWKAAFAEFENMKPRNVIQTNKLIWFPPDEEE